MAAAASVAPQVAHQALAVADDFAARHGHLAVSRPTTADGFALGAWLAAACASAARAGPPAWDSA